MWLWNHLTYFTCWLVLTWNTFELNLLVEQRLKNPPRSWCHKSSKTIIFFFTLPPSPLPRRILHIYMHFTKHIPYFTLYFFDHRYCTLRFSYRMGCPSKEIDPRWTGSNHLRSPKMGWSLLSPSPEMMQKSTPHLWLKKKGERSPLFTYFEFEWMLAALHSWDGRRLFWETSESRRLKNQ